MISMPCLIFYTFTAFGVCWGIGGSKLSLPVRERLSRHGSIAVNWLLELVECPACFGFWIGLAVGLLAGFDWYSLALAFYTAGVNFVLGRVTGLIDNP